MADDSHDASGGCEVATEALEVMVLVSAQATKGKVLSRMGVVGSAARGNT
jgi:hypothetical protein